MKLFVMILVLFVLGAGIGGYLLLRGGRTTTTVTAPTTNTSGEMNVFANAPQDSTAPLQSEEQELTALDLNATFRELDATDRDLATPSVDVNVSL